MRRSHSFPLLFLVIMAVLTFLLPVEQALGMINTPTTRNLLAPTVSGISPNSGSAAGGTLLTITGTNFTVASTVNFGSTTATGVTVTSNTSITATAPAGSAGVVDVIVVTPIGTSATSSADQFTYVPQPTLLIPKTIPGLNQGINLFSADHFVVSAPSTAVEGTPFSFTVEAESSLNTIATGYTGTVSFTSDDQSASLPPFKTLTNGTGTFTAILRTIGLQTLTATDASNSALTGSTNIQVSAAPSTSLPSSLSLSTSPIVIHFHIGSTDSDINGQSQPSTLPRSSAMGGRSCRSSMLPPRLAPQSTGIHRNRWSR